MNASLMTLEICVMALGVVLMLADFWLPAERKKFAGYAAIAALTGLGVLALLVLVLVSIRDEDRRMSLTSIPRTRTEAITRRLLGVGVRARHGNDQIPPGSELT